MTIVAAVAMMSTTATVTPPAMMATVLSGVTGSDGGEFEVVTATPPAGRTGTAIIQVL